jgi:hypothetical protein
MSHEALQQNNVHSRLFDKGLGTDSPLARISQVLEDLAINGKLAVCRPCGLGEISDAAAFP